MQLKTLYDLFLASTGISIDSRKIEKGNIFFAFQGNNVNGNDFAQAAITKGALCAVVSDEKVATNDTQYFLTDSTLTTLQALANYHRKQLTIPIIGITGSNGKTTTKELVYAVLSKKYHVLATKGNLNNHIGVPLTLLQIRGNIDIAVIEMGANRVGDIAELCAIAEPNYGMITNIGHAHLEGFGSYDGVIKGKTELYQHLEKSKGTALINVRTTILREYISRLSKVIAYGDVDKNSIYDAQIIATEPFISYRSETGKTIETQILGAYNFDNILAALAFAKLFEVDMNAAHAAISAYMPSNNRSQMIKAASNTIILDAYNANPSSMKAALENFDKMSIYHKLAILGDMFELGEYSEEKHREIVELTQEMSIQTLLFCGEEFAKVKRATDRGVFFDSKEALKVWLTHHPIKNAHILVKASRGIGLESLLDALKD